LSYEVARHALLLFGGFANGVIVACECPVGGGCDCSGPLADTWSRPETSAWIQEATPTAPAAPGISAYDSARGVTVFITPGGLGGFEPQSSNGTLATWEWDGASWTQRTPNLSPPSSFTGAMAYDVSRGRMVLFGARIDIQGSAPPAGCTAFVSGGDLCAETWEYDGTTWLERTPGLSPPPRLGHSVAYDTARGVTVLFGGATSLESDGLRGDTWEWDGTEWRERQPATSPPPCWLHAMAYDSSRHVTVLFGGAGGDSAEPGTTWEWDGTSWTPHESPQSPPPRLGGALAYDSDRSVMVLFGGQGTTKAGTLNDMWEWRGAP
jgi:hypothetical protein